MPSTGQAHSLDSAAGLHTASARHDELQHRSSEWETQLFVLAFVVGPFLFGFVFSRNKKNRLEQAEALQQEKKE